MSPVRAPKKFFNRKKENPTEYLRKPDQEYLIIVESPSKCAKIEQFLGVKYKCIATVGHLREIGGLKSLHLNHPVSKTGDEVLQNDIITFSISTEKQDHIEKMRKIISQFTLEHIYLATDDDREGEAIAWHICDIFGLNVDTSLRITFHEITAPALLYAVNHPGKINMDLVRAQWARQVLDILIGYKISPLLWKHMYYDKENSLSAGRCQTPALRLVYDNHRERIQSTGPDKKYKVLGNFTGKHLEFVLNREFSRPEEVKDFLEKSVNFNHTLSLGSRREVSVEPPRPFNTSVLLQTASNLLHMSPKDTMKCCQMLYQDGLITYMRTEGQTYSESFLKETKDYIVGSWGENHVGNLKKLENCHASNPHEAIRVTHLSVPYLTGTKYSGKIASLYQLIWRTSIQSCMTAGKNQLIDAFISSPIENVQYKHTIEIPIFLGWKMCKNISPDTGKKETEENAVETQQSKGRGLCLYLESLLSKKSVHPTVPFNKIETIVTFYHCHSHYTESGLIKKLEDLGIGRPSTFAMFIETILDRGYVKKMDIAGEEIICEEYYVDSDEKRIKTTQKKRIVGNEKAKLVIQPTGNLVIEFLMKHFDTIFDYDYSRDLESKLDNISQGITGHNWYQLCKDCDVMLKQFITPLNALTKTVYNLEDTHILTFSKYGPVIREKPSPGKEAQFISINKNVVLDLDKLKRGEYTVKELEENTTRCLGKWEDQDIYLKHGRFGHYLEWGENKISCSEYDKPISNITIDDVTDIIQSKNKKNMNILRVLTPEMSVRRGKFGAYVYYKASDMKKPQFFNIKKFKEGVLTCEPETLIDWIVHTYLNK